MSHERVCMMALHLPNKPLNYGDDCDNIPVVSKMSVGFKKTLILMFPQLLNGVYYLVRRQGAVMSSIEFTQANYIFDGKRIC